MINYLYTEIEELNNKFWQGEFEEAVEICEYVLQQKGEEWKIPYLKLVCENAKSLNYRCIFSSQTIDLIVMSKDGRYVFPVYFMSEDLDGDDLKGNIIDVVDYNIDFTGSLIKHNPLNSKQVIKSIILGSKNEEWYKDAFSDFVEIFREVYFASVKTFKLTDLLPEKRKVELDQQYGTTLFRLSLGMEVDDEEAPVSYSSALDLAPKSYLSFIKNTQLVESTLDNPEELFSMRLNCVLVNDKNIDVYQLVKLFQSSLFENKDIVSIDFSTLNDTDALESKLSNWKHKVVLIENIDKKESRDNLIQNPFRKDELIEAFCNNILKESCNMFFLSLNKHEWEKITSTYPVLRVCFQNVFYFNHISADTIQQHFVKELKDKGLEITQEALELSFNYFEYMKSFLSKKQFNTGISTMLASEVRYNYALRTSVSNQENNSIITKQDVIIAIQDEYQEDNSQSLPEIMKKLNDLTGLQSVKESISSLTNLVKINRLRGNSSSISLNSIFMGNPGTGKTTLASILGEIYKAIGVLPKGHLVAASRQNIVGQYIGDTEQNMRNLIKQAKGGILFIDEAYSLYKTDSPRDFGLDAINVLVDEMENIKDTTCVILAGYTTNMEQFLNANPGLKSRFPHIINFPDYSSEELVEIFMGFMQKESFSMDRECIGVVSDYFNNLVADKDINFGNGRVCRNLFEKLKQIHANRLVRENVQVGDDKLLNFIKEDIERLLCGVQIEQKDVIANPQNTFIDSSYYVRR